MIKSLDVSAENLAFLRKNNITGIAQLSVLLTLDHEKSLSDAAKEAEVSPRCVELLIARKNQNFKQMKFKPGAGFSPKGRHPTRAIKRSAQGDRLYKRLISEK